MATWMNEYEVDRAKATIDERAPEIAPYAQYLRDWVDVVNSNSDGWPYWKAGSRCAGKLQELLERAVKAIRDGRDEDMPSEAELRRSLAPIKSLATKKGLRAPELQEAAAAPRP
jgi:hypothetical protein